MIVIIEKLLMKSIGIRLFSRTVPSREVPGRSRDGTGQDLETLKVPGLKKSKSPGTFFEGPGTPRPLFLDRILLIRFKTKVHQ